MSWAYASRALIKIEMQKTVKKNPTLCVCSGHLQRKYCQQLFVSLFREKLCSGFGDLETELQWANRAF